MDKLTRMVHYEPIHFMINIVSLAEMIIDIIIQHHGIPNFIVSNRKLVFTFKL